MNTHPNTPPNDPEELVNADDRVIGRAFRWSLIVLMVAGLSVAGLIYYLKHRSSPPPTLMTQISAPVASANTQADIPVATFTEVTRSAGIRFSHINGAAGDKLLPETMGGGCAFLDFDNDGDQDLLFINSTFWPGKAGGGDQPARMALYRNDGKGHFEEVTAASGLDISIYGMGVAIGDYDNDGRVDVFVTAVGGNHLFHNEGLGKFNEATDQAGVGGSAAGWSTGCAWLDYDNDGKLDLFVCNYVRWSREIDFEVGYKLVGVGRAYGPPMNFEGTFPYLYHNDGNGHFTEVSRASGIQIKNPALGVPAAKSLGIAPVDLDGDGWMDLVVANDTVQNFVFHNQRNGTFREIGAVSGIAFDSYGNARGAMGIDTAYYRNDASLGVGIGNFANEMVALYVSQKNPLEFADEAIPEGVGPPSRSWLKFGLFFFDYDLDGRLDLLTANGHLEAEINKIQKSQTYAQPAQLFWNSGARNAATFVTVPAVKCGKDIFSPIVGRGSAYADIDGDGDLDVVLTQVAGPPLLLRNDQALNHHWLRLKLVGAKSNRDAIGAKIIARLGDQTLTRVVMPTRSYLSQSELPVTIGLGAVSQAGPVEIIWPSGQRQTVANLKVDVETVIEEPR